MSSYPYVDFVKQVKQVMPADPDETYYRDTMNTALDNLVEQQLFRIRGAVTADIYRFGGLDVEYWYPYGRQATFDIFEGVPNFWYFTTISDSVVTPWYNELIDLINNGPVGIG